jgi:hypothetical protein
MAWTDNFPWVQAIVGSATILGTVLKLPAARLDWAEEHRRTARIERQAKVMESVNHPSVKRIFESDNEWQALRILALRKLPYKRGLRAGVYLGRFAYLGSVILVGCAIWYGWSSIPFVFIILSVFLAFSINRVATDRLKLYKVNRRMFALLGAPDRFRYATKSKVSRHEDPTKKRHIAKELELRARTWEWANMDVTGDEMRTEMWCIWNEILDEQRQPSIRRGQTLRERLMELNEIDPRPEVFEYLQASLDRTEARVTNRLGGRIRPRPGFA